MSRGFITRLPSGAAVSAVVLLVAGALLTVAASTAGADHSVGRERVDGANRFATAASLALVTFNSSDSAIVAAGGDYPDALAASYGPAGIDAPVLLSEHRQVPDTTMEALDGLDATSVYVLGGQAALHADVEQQLDDAGYETVRVAGDTRYETARAMLERPEEPEIGTLDGERTALLASGEDFADALAAGPLAAQADLPLLLTTGEHSDVTEAAADAMEGTAHDVDIERVVIIGGSEAVSEDVEDYLRGDRGFAVERWAGPTRVDTAAEVADEAEQRLGFAAERAMLARGDDFPDALTVSAHAASHSAPLLLSHDPDRLGHATGSWLAARCPEVEAVRAVGGGAAVSDATLDEAAAAAEACHTAEDAAVAVTNDGRVVVLEPDTGDEVRELMSGVPTDDPVKNDLAVTPDQDAVYVAVPAGEPSGEEEIVRIPLSGGDPETVASGGSSPAVSPDGGTLAYVVYVGDGVGHPEPRLVLRDLGTGDERELTDGDDFHFISDVSWTADGDEVVFTDGEVFTGVHAIDAQATTMAEARRLGPEAGVAETSWGSTAAFGQRLAVVESCCDPPDQEHWRILDVDPADGSVHGSLVPEEGIQATHTDSNADATGLLIVEGEGKDGGPLQRWSGYGSPQTVTDDIIVAAW